MLFDVNYILRISKELEFMVVSLDKMGADFIYREDLNERQKLEEWIKEFINFFYKSKLQERIERCQNNLYISIIDSRLKNKFKKEATLLCKENNYWQKVGDYCDDFYGKRSFDEEYMEDLEEDDNNYELTFENALYLYKNLDYITMSIQNIQENCDNNTDGELIQFLYKSLLLKRLSYYRAYTSTYTDKYMFSDDSDRIEEFWEEVNIPHWRKSGDFYEKSF